VDFLDGVLNFKLIEKMQVLHGIYRLCRPGAGRKTCVEWLYIWFYYFKYGSFCSKSTTRLLL